MRTVEIKVNREGLDVVVRDPGGRVSLIEFMRTISPHLDALERAVREPSQK